MAGQSRQPLISLTSCQLAVVWFSSSDALHGPGHGLCYGGRLSATALLSTRLRSPCPQPTNSQPWLGLPRTYLYFLPPGFLNSRSQLSAQPPSFRPIKWPPPSQPGPEMWLGSVASGRRQNSLPCRGSLSASTFPDRASTCPAIVVSCNLAAIITLIGVASPPFRSVAMGLRPKRAHSRVHVHRARFRVFRCYDGAASYRAGVGAEVASFFPSFCAARRRGPGFDRFKQVITSYPT
ncbi:hypothetical protein BT67DRAFT_195184 [Trichocladium antarcticum]|uniref:Uncharacterized protein n=1 Tax=Trichocladium antarcticum TaxID=1450529 RepID=A0AAN6ZFX9_9PEZI|nr:hypothetical protein BT67DRAFT_195184 [Trichocladium antarcticum]